MIDNELLAAATASGEKVVNFCTTLLATGEEVFGSDQTSAGVSNVWMDDLKEQSKPKKRREVYERANRVQSVFGQMLQRKDSRRERGKAVGTENPWIFRKAIKPGKATSCSIFNTWVLRLVSGNFLFLSRTPNSAYYVQAAVWSDHIVSFVF